MSTPTWAWCFDHGRLHSFAADREPWCTASWVAFAAASEEAATAAKEAAYGNAQFFHDLPTDKQIEVMEIRESWMAR